MDSQTPDRRFALATLFHDNPRLGILFTALVLVSGLSALALLPRREDPELVGRYAVVQTVYPGASAERVESLVTERLEDELRDIEEIKLLESASRTGSGLVVLELADSVDAGDVNEVWSRARDAVGDAARLFPTGVLAPEFLEQQVDAKAGILALVWRGEGPAPMGILTRIGDDLVDRMRALRGTDEVTNHGFVVEEVLVEADATRLAELGLTAAALAGRIQAADAKVSAGRFDGATTQLAIEVEGRFESPERVRDLVVLIGSGGQEVRLRDVARVSKGWREPVTEKSFIDGARAVIVDATLLDTVRVDEWAVRMRELASEFGAALPRGIELEVLLDQSRYTEQRLGNLAANLAAGMGLVVLVLFVMMGWRAALLVGLALPLSTLMVLGAMRFLALPIHQMSVTGLIIALGLLIDNAIVMVDEVRHERGQGKTAREAIGGSVRRLFVPLLGSTLTTVLAFMPIVLMPGPAGEFVGAIGITVSLALVSSFLASMTVVATAAAHFGGVPGKGFLSGGLSPQWLMRGYDRFLGLAFRAPLLTAAISTVPSILGFVGARTLAEQFFPPTDRDQFQVQVWMPQQSSLDDTQRAFERLREVALGIEGVRAAHAFLGRSAPKFYYNIPEGIENVAYYGQALIELDQARGAQGIVRELQRRLDAELPEAQCVARLLEQGPPFDAPVEVRLFGPDLDVLEREGRRLRGLLSAVPGVTHTRQTLDADQLKLELDVDDYELESANLSAVPLARALAGLIDGTTGGSLLEATEELPVRVRLGAEGRDQLADLRAIPIALSTSADSRAWASLETLGELRLTPEFASIPHRNGERLTTVQGFLEAGLLPSIGLAGLEQRLADTRFELPPGYRLETGGESEERDLAISNLMASAGLLVVLMAATLVLAFHSFRMAAIIGTVAPLAIGLGLGALVVFGHPFGFMAIIGTMGLVGVAINDSIVVLAGIREDPEARTGDPQAVRTVVVRASRHVFSTTLTTMAGFLPLIIAGGQFWPPLAVAIGFGVTGATLLALVFVPAIYLTLFGGAHHRALAAA